MSLLLWTLTACAPGFEGRMAEVAKEIGANESAAVAWIYEDPSGNVTAYGDGWRDRVEQALRDNRVPVKARKDIGVIIDDVESYGLGVEEQQLWEQAGADVVVSGHYRIGYRQVSGGKEPRLHLTVKALRVADSSVLKTLIWDDKPEPGWEKRVASVKGNALQKDVEILTDPHADNNRPLLSAKLDRSPACYPTGSAGQVLIHTDPGSHVYILNLAADNSVTLLYPNSKMPDQPLPGGVLNFPPKAMAKEIQLAFYPLSEGEMCQEAIKVVASRLPMDFSYLPVPENAIFAGATGGDIKKVSATLKNARGWSESLLGYWVGPGCE